MQKNRFFTTTFLVIVTGLLVVSIGTIVMLTGTTSFAMTKTTKIQTDSKSMSGNTNTTGTMSEQICTPHYPC